MTFSTTPPRALMAGVAGFGLIAFGLTAAIPQHKSSKNPDVAPDTRAMMIPRGAADDKPRHWAPRSFASAIDLSQRSEGNRSIRRGGSARGGTTRPTLSPTLTRRMAIERAGDALTTPETLLLIGSSKHSAPIAAQSAESAITLVRGAMPLPLSKLPNNPAPTISATSKFLRGTDEKLKEVVRNYSGREPSLASITLGTPNDPALEFSVLEDGNHDSGLRSRRAIRSASQKRATSPTLVSDTTEVGKKKRASDAQSVLAASEQASRQKIADLRSLGTIAALPTDVGKMLEELPLPPAFEDFRPGSLAGPAANAPANPNADFDDARTQPDNAAFTSWVDGVTIHSSRVGSNRSEPNVDPKTPELNPRVAIDQIEETSSSVFVAQIAPSVNLEGMAVRLFEKAIGDVAFQVDSAGKIEIRVSQILDLLEDRFDEADFARLRNSDASREFVSLTDLRGNGIPVRYDPVYDELIIGG